MRICLYTGTALPRLGGQESAVDALARQFLKLGHEPIVLAPYRMFPLTPRDSSHPYRVLRHLRFFSTRRYVDWYQRFLLNAHRRHQFDVVHCHDIYPTGYLAALNRSKLHLPVVMTSHGGDVRPGSPRLNKQGLRQRYVTAVKSADALISIGRFTHDGFVQLGADPLKIKPIPNGVDLTQFDLHATRPPEIDSSISAGAYLLFLGRLTRRKGVDVLLDALATLPASGGTELVIAGTGDERANIQHRIASMQLQSRVKMVGRVSGETKIWLLQNARCVVVPSRGWEAFPLVVLEAGAAGRAVIGSRISGLEDVIVQNQTGLLVTPESPADLAIALRKVRDEAQWTDQTGKTARAHAADYSWNRIAAGHVELYCQLVSERSRRS
jgi:glycosyltransferase involved in cell wall biosynthesis